MTTSERRVVVSTMTARHQVSERRACRVLGFERTGIRYVPTRPVTDARCAPACVNWRPRTRAGASRDCTGGCSVKACR